MPTATLIARAQNLAMWDQAVPQFQPIHAHEDRRLLKIENVVTTCSCKQQIAHSLALPDQKRQHPNQTKSRFSSRRFKLRRPVATMLLFRSMNEVIAGTKSIGHALLAHHSFHLLLCRMTKRRTLQPIKFAVQNIVASAHVGYAIDLAGVAVKLSAECSYDPNLFPGARIRLQDCPSTSILLFSSGNAVITGAKVEHDVVHAFGVLYPLLVPYFGEKTTPKHDKGKRYRTRNIN